jgi:lytic murein transglycosylase
MQFSGDKPERTLALRHAICVAGALIVWLQGVTAHADANFDNWRARLWGEVQARGIRQDLFNWAMRLPLDLSLPDLVIPGQPVKEQAEFMRLASEYLAAKQLMPLARRGYQLLLRNRSLLERIEAEYGVPGNVVIAIWGRETDYGAERQRHQVIRSLVTLAYLGRRKDLFRDELLTALQLIQEGRISKNAMGSWSGAMGHTQFEPTDFVKFAVDADGDQKIDLTNSIPDALASAAKQLRDYGWQRSKTWGFEVRLPAGVSCVESASQIKRPLSEWLDRGVMPTGNASVSTDMLKEPASLILPAGDYGPAFLSFENFQVFRRYNQSDNYALFVGQLSDLIVGGAEFEKPWAKLPRLHSNEIEEIQKLLQTRQLYSEKIDGRLGSATRRAIGLFQQGAGLTVDCWPSPGLLDTLRPTQVETGAAVSAQKPTRGVAKRPDAAQPRP